METNRLPKDHTFRRRSCKRRLVLWAFLSMFLVHTVFLWYCHHQLVEETEHNPFLSMMVKDEEQLPLFTICLLTRDDLPILPEWIAYHYHSVGLKHLVVAVDPGSQKDPDSVLENFRRHLPDLVIDEWHDEDFMPDYFVQGDYGRAPNFYGSRGSKGEYNDTETWYEHYSKLPHFGPFKIRDQTLINSHRYRQTRFLSRCSEHLMSVYKGAVKRPLWMSTLDTDEYLAINPWKVQGVPEAAKRLERGSVLEWWAKDQTTAKVCRPIPRLLFGAIELANRTEATQDQLEADVVSSMVRTPQKTLDLVSNWPRSSSTLDTLRWKFHAAPDDERNFQQKVVLDLRKIPDSDEIWGDHVRTVHRPSRALCIPETEDNLHGKLLLDSPMVAYHYIGTEEQYFSRPMDRRRNHKRYKDRSNITHGRDETGWIDQWLERFVESVGLDTVASLLPEHVVDQTTSITTTVR